MHKSNNVCYWLLRFTKLLRLKLETAEQGPVLTTECSGETIESIVFKVIFLKRFFSSFVMICKQGFMLNNNSLRAIEFL